MEVRRRRRLRRQLGRAGVREGELPPLPVPLRQPQVRARLLEVRLRRRLRRRQRREGLRAGQLHQGPVQVQQRTVHLQQVEVRPREGLPGEVAKLSDSSQNFGLELT